MQKKYKFEWYPHGELLITDKREMLFAIPTPSKTGWHYRINYLRNIKAQKDNWLFAAHYPPVNSGFYAPVSPGMDVPCVFSMFETWRWKTLDKRKRDAMDFSYNCGTMMYWVEEALGKIQWWLPINAPETSQ